MFSKGYIYHITYSSNYTSSLEFTDSYMAPMIEEAIAMYKEEHPGMVIRRIVVDGEITYKPTTTITKG